MAEENLVENVRVNGKYLGELLHKHLDDHPHVGNIRGRGFFWSVSLLKRKHHENMTVSNAVLARICGR